jgi:hypothetical protein
VATKLVAFRFPEHLIGALAAEAETEGVTRTEIVRTAVEERLGFRVHEKNGSEGQRSQLSEEEPA